MVLNFRGSKMLKKLFRVLGLFVLLSLLCFAVVLFYKKNSTSPLLLKPLVGNGYDTLSWMTTQRAQELWGKKPEVQTSTLTSKSLGPCPRTSPKLLGPLRVEFNVERTLDEVPDDISSAVQVGGRYKPTDCISRHKVAIIIPFRDRHDHLKHWLFYLHPILIRQQLDYGVYVINQDGTGVFNRAKLMNAGYVEALKEYDYECFVFSDVDLIPMDDRNLYACFDNPRHLAVAMDKFKFNLPYKTYFGGVSSLSKKQFLKINGFPNTFWGWGGEDDDIYKRIIYSGMSISRPDLVIGKYRMIKHERDLLNKYNPENARKLHTTHLTMETDGINSLNYTVKEIVKNPLNTFITVDIDAPPT